MREMWINFWKSINACGDPFAIFSLLEQHYSQPHRAYHNLNHIEACLNEFRQSRQFCEHPAEVEMAIWMHDVIYDPKAKDNEERSADFARKIVVDAKLGDDFARRTTDLILATKHAALPAGADACVLVDVDLSILGKPPDEFDAYEVKIRREYDWVPAEAFRAGRAAVLRQFLQRPHIYSTNYFRGIYEDQARRNLQRSIERLLARTT